MRAKQINTETLVLHFDRIPALIQIKLELDQWMSSSYIFNKENYNLFFNTKFIDLLYNEAA